MLKKILSVLLCMILITSVNCINSIAGEEKSGKTIKKVVSIVYDDSGSMASHNENWAYASYSLQNLISLMNSGDELSVVKMSSPTQTINFNMFDSNERATGIKTVEGWRARGNTPFVAVQTAVDWLKSKKSGYSDSQAVEFWLVVITDGSFETGYPANMTNYLNDLKSAMGNSKYEGVFVAIGTGVPQKVKSDWTTVAGNHIISASNNDDIVNAMSEVSGLILGQGGKSTAVNVSLTPNGKGIKFNTYFPLKKFIVYEQNQSAGITSVSVKGAKTKVSSDFASKKPGNGNITSRTIHCIADETDFIPAGEITVNFDSKIDISSNKLKILTDTAVNINFHVLDKTGKEITDLTKAGLVEGDLVEFSAVVTSSVDNTPIKLIDWANDLQAELIVNNQIIKMEYKPNENTFYGSFNVQSGSNMAYAIVTLPGYFRAKSDVVNIYPIELIDNAVSKFSSTTIDVPYKYCNKYEEIASFTYSVSGGKISGICDFKFKNLPKGINVSVSGIMADENGKISVKIHNDVPAEVKFYRNKNYKETENSKIKVEVTSEQYELKWNKNSITEIILKPVKREIELQTVKGSPNDKLALNDFDGKPIYKFAVLADGKYLSKEELESLKFNYEKVRGIKFDSKVRTANGKSFIEITGEKNGISLAVKTGDIKTDISAATIYGEKTENTPMDFYLKDSITKFFIPLGIIILLAIILGYLPGIKKRFNKKYYIQANGESEEIYVKPATKFLPYISEKGSASDLSVIATSNKNKIKVKNEFSEDQSLILEGEYIKEKYFEIHEGEHLTVSDANRSLEYVYCNSSDDDSYDYDYGTDDSNDMFGSGTDDSDTESEDEFF